MYNSTIYYNLKQSIYRYRRSINIITEKIRLVFRANLPCPFSSTLGFRFISSSQLHILSACLKYAMYMYYPFKVTFLNIHAKNTHTPLKIQLLAVRTSFHREVQFCTTLTISTIDTQCFTWLKFAFKAVLLPGKDQTPHFSNFIKKLKY